MPGMQTSKPKLASPPNPMDVAIAARAKLECKNIDSVKNAMHEQSLEQQRMHLQQLQMQERETPNMMMQQPVAHSSASRVSCLSLGSISSLASFGDIPLEDLLQSGSDLDSMLKSGHYQSFGKTSAFLDLFGTKMNSQQSLELKYQFLADLAAANACGAAIPLGLPVGGGAGNMPQQNEFQAGHFQEPPPQMKPMSQGDYTAKYSGPMMGLC
eukprot:13341700-Ditylum_brightwellii.AAC.1